MANIDMNIRWSEQEVQLLTGAILLSLWVSRIADTVVLDNIEQSYFDSCINGQVQYATPGIEIDDAEQNELCEQQS